MADAYYCPEGPGGNVTIVNQDERAILDATIAGVPVRTAALGVEDDSHVSIGYKDAEI